MSVPEFTDPPRFPIGTPEYAAYADELRAELAKFAQHEPSYDYRADCNACLGDLHHCPDCDGPVGHGHIHGEE